MPTPAIIHTDGGARGNPGPAGIGVVLETGGVTHTFKQFIGTATNNQAEYRAVILALEEAGRLGCSELKVYVDSELVARQLQRQYRVKDAALGKLFIAAWNLIQGFRRVSVHSIPREDNRGADRLVNQAIDDALAGRTG